MSLKTPASEDKQKHKTPKTLMINPPLLQLLTININ